MSNKQGSDNQIELDDGESMILEEEIDENYEPTQEGSKSLIYVTLCRNC